MLLRKHDYDIEFVIGGVTTSVMFFDITEDEMRDRIADLGWVAPCWYKPKTWKNRLYIWVD